MNINLIEKENIQEKICECGCGRKTLSFTCDGKIRRFILGHNAFNRIVTRETRKKLSESNMGHVCTPETRKKIGLIHLGKKHGPITEEQREARRLRHLKNNPICVDYFKDINPRNAYVLGYLFADGSLHKREDSGYTLSFCSIDEELIKKIKQEFNIQRKKIRRTQRSDRRGYKNKGVFYVRIRNYHFLKHLINLGMISGKKCDRIFVPKLISENKKIFFSFFRGFFDGDGYVPSIKDLHPYPYPNLCVTTASYNFLLQVQKITLKFGINSGNIRKVKDKNVFCLWFYSKQNTYNLYKLMYQNSNNLFLSRKKQRFDEFFKSYGWKLV